MNIWPANPPNAKPATQPESYLKHDLTNVSVPTISVYRPPAGKGNGTAILVYPGGGFKKVVIKKEGTDIVPWLNSIGVTAIVVKYRVPYEQGTAKYLMAMQDAQRAICLVRSHAADWNIDPHRIGVIGFSAGGKLVADISTNFDKPAYRGIDEIDNQSARPDFALAIYPGDLDPRDGTTNVTPDVRPSKETPPTFLAIALDDKTTNAPDHNNGPQNAVYYYMALQKAGANVELHVFSEGKHGFALRPSTAPHAIWPQLAANWMNYHGLLGTVPATEPEVSDQ